MFTRRHISPEEAREAYALTRLIPHNGGWYACPLTAVAKAYSDVGLQLSEDTVAERAARTYGFFYMFGFTIGVDTKPVGPSPDLSPWALVWAIPALLIMLAAALPKIPFWLGVYDGYRCWKAIVATPIDYVRDPAPIIAKRRVERALEGVAI